MLKDLGKLYRDIQNVLVRNKGLDLTTVIDLHKDQLGLLVETFDKAEYTPDKLITEQWVAKECISYLMPKLDRIIRLSGDSITDAQLLNAHRIWKQAFALAGQRSFHHFLLYIEHERDPSTQVYTNRLDVLSPLTYYLTKMTFETQFLTLVASYPPSYGKSYVMWHYEAWIFGVNNDFSIMKLSYDESLLGGFSKSITELMSSPLYAEVFPRFALFDNKPFSVNQSLQFMIKGASNVPMSHLSVTRDGGVTGKRGNFAMVYDDMTKGAEEATNDLIHEKYWKKYTTEYVNRKASSNVKEILIGTMWNPKDILGRASELFTKRGRAVKSKRKYCMEILNPKNEVISVVIRVPQLDENDISTCEAARTTQEALELRDNTDEFLWSCVYQQDPIPPTGRAFTYSNLRTYSLEGKDFIHNHKLIELSDYAYASLDPVRKGTDFVAMPIFKYDVRDEADHYLIDALYQGKSMDEMYDKIVDMIIRHKIVKFAIEVNIDVSLKTLLGDRLHAKGYFGCEIIELYSVKNKARRIYDESHVMVKHLIYPEENLYGRNSDIGKFMVQLGIYSFDSANKNDDVPDAIAMYVSEIYKGGSQPNKVEILDRRLYGI